MIQLFDILSFILFFIFDFKQEYVLRVRRGISEENSNNSWRVLRRYNEFAALHKDLQISGIDLPLPAKKIVGEFWSLCFSVLLNLHSHFDVQTKEKCF